MNCPGANVMRCIYRCAWRRSRQQSNERGHCRSSSTMSWSTLTRTTRARHFVALLVLRRTPRCCCSRTTLTSSPSQSRCSPATNSRCIGSLPHRFDRSAGNLGVDSCSALETAYCRRRASPTCCAHWLRNSLQRPPSTPESGTAAAHPRSGSSDRLDHHDPPTTGIRRFDQRVLPSRMRLVSNRPMRSVLARHKGDSSPTLSSGRPEMPSTSQPSGSRRTQCGRTCGRPRPLI